MRFPRCIDEPVDLTPVIIFLDISVLINTRNIVEIQEKAIGSSIRKNNKYAIYEIYKIKSFEKEIQHLYQIEFFFEQDQS